MKKSLYLLIIALVFSAANMFGQPSDNNFQKFYSDVQQVLGKQVESISASDLTLLREAMKLDPMTFGAANQKLAKKILTDATQKKADYDNWMATKEKLGKTEEELSTTVVQRDVAVARGDSLYGENVQLKELIERLQQRINKLEKEKKSINNLNKKIREERLKTDEMLESSRKSLSKIMALLPGAMPKGDSGRLPTSLKDSLNQSECQICDLLKTNYLLTLEGMERDQKFIDSATAFYKEKKMHTAQLDQYFVQGSDLVVKLRAQGVDCANNYATEIETKIGEFKGKIETGGQSAFAKFLSNNWIMLTLLGVAILVIIYLITSKKKPTGGSSPTLMS